MADYRRLYVEGGTYFFTVVTQDRRPLFGVESNRELLGQAIRSVRNEIPFEVIGLVLLPDHLHALWTQPEGDSDFSKRWHRIKARFTRSFLAAGHQEGDRPDSRVRRGTRGIWQRRFWEHLCRDETDLQRHLDYIHFNPVKHGYVRCPHEWEWSTFEACCRRGWYERRWSCGCGAEAPTPPPNFRWAKGLE